MRLSVAIWEWPERIAAAMPASSALLMVFVMPTPLGSMQVWLSVLGWYRPAPIV